MKTCMIYFTVVCMGMCLPQKTLAVDAQPGTWYHPGTAIENGGFEQWSAEAGTNADRTPMLGNDKAPRNWMPDRTPGKGAIKIMKDTEIKHSGEASARVEVADTGDDACLKQHFSVEPNTSYLIRLWVRGKDIVPATSKPLPGILIWANSGPAGDEFWGNQKSMPKQPPKASGTFDWQLFEFTVETGPNAARLGISLQLRWASGTAWFDDVEVIKREAVTPVKSY